MITKILTSLLVFLFVFSVPLKAQDNLEKGISAVKRGDYVQALELLKGVSKDSYEANLYYGIALFETGSSGDAEKSLKSAISKDNERPEAYSILGEIYTEQKKYSEAAVQFEKSKNFLPLNKSKDDLEKAEIELIISVLKAESENFIADGKVDKAIASLTTAKIYDNKNPLIYVGLGDAYYARGAFEPAKTNYDQALKYKSNYAPALYGLGKIAFKKKKYSEALENFLKATDADNNFAPAFFEKGLIFYYLDRFVDAIDAFERYDKLVPGSPRGKTYLAKAYYGKRDCERSKQILDEVLAKDPNYSEANKYYAYCLIENKEYEKALEYFNKIKPEDLNAEDETKIATIYISLKEFSKAYEHLDKAILMDSLEANTYFEYGKAYFGEQKYTEANEKFAKSIELGVLNVGTYVYSAISYYYTKEYQLGIDRLNQYLEKDPSIAIKSVYLWYGNNYVGLNKNTEACESYKKYLEFEPNDQFVKDQVQNLCEPK
ncbi:MAG TPA: tetratricopeptide repeat protein [Ignavibacteria bacterium]|nr:tetratricopeptide repeat protein [Ignavibacteria bacterium]